MDSLECRWIGEDARSLCEIEVVFLWWVLREVLFADSEQDGDEVDDIRSGWACRFGEFAYGGGNVDGPFTCASRSFFSTEHEG